MKKQSFADPLDSLDYTRIHLALLLHMYMRRYESFALECAAVDECGDLGTSKSLEEPRRALKSLEEPRRAQYKDFDFASFEVVRCRAMPCDVEAGNAQLQVLAPKALAREPLGSTWLHLAPLGSTWLRPVCASIISVSSVSSLLNQGTQKLNGKIRYGAKILAWFEVQTWDGLRCSSQFSVLARG